MKKIIKIIGSLFVIFNITVFILQFFSSYIFPWKEKEAIATTLNWVDLLNCQMKWKILALEKMEAYLQDLLKLNLKLVKRKLKIGFQIVKDFVRINQQ